MSIYEIFYLVLLLEYYLLFFEDIVNRGMNLYLVLVLVIRIVVLELSLGLMFILIVKSICYDVIFIFSFDL